ncbi:TPA: hypothetical protein ACQUJH_000839 [Neisseria cinerea]
MALSILNAPSKKTRRCGHEKGRLKTDSLVFSFAETLSSLHLAHRHGSNAERTVDNRAPCALRSKGRFHTRPSFQTASKSTPYPQYADTGKSFDTPTDKNTLTKNYMQIIITTSLFL